MTKIVIAGSLRHARDIKIIAEWLDSMIDFEVVHYAQKCETCTLPDECFFYQKIRECDTLLVVGRDDTIGKAVSAEIGFAYALGKKILCYHNLWDIQLDECVKSLITGCFFRPGQKEYVETCDNCQVIRFIRADEYPYGGHWCGACMAAEMGEE